MTLARRNLFAGLVIALPAALAIFFAVGWLETRDREALLERIADSFMSESMRDACEADPQWFLAGPRTGRPRPEERQQPDADVRLPRPSAAELPFEFFAYDEDFTPRSVAGPRFPDAFKRTMKQYPETKKLTSTYASGMGPGIQTVINTGWGVGSCTYLLFRQPGPPHRMSTQGGLFVGLYLVCLLVAWVAAAPTSARIRRLSKEAKDSSRQDYADMVHISGRDEISSLGAVFNDTAADIRRKATDARDREEALRRYVENTTEDVAVPLAALEQDLARMATAAGETTLRRSATEAHRLSMQLQNQAAVVRLRGVTDGSPREAVDLAAIVAKLVAARASLAAAAGITVDASRATTPVVIQADAALVEQAIANVLDNAIIYNTSGGSVTVSLASYEHGRNFKLVIADNGPGVSDEEFAGLTANKRFRGDESRTRRPGGRGLGLALAREVADRFGMKLDLRQPTGGGFEAEFSPRASISVSSHGDTEETRRHGADWVGAFPHNQVFAESPCASVSPCELTPHSSNSRFRACASILARVSRSITTLTATSAAMTTVVSHARR